MDVSLSLLSSSLFCPPPPHPEIKVYFNFFFSFSFLFFPYRATIWSVNARTIPSLGVPSLWADCRRERRPASPICSTGPASTSPSATVYPHWPLYCTRSASKNCTRKKFETVFIYVFLLRDDGDSSGSHRAPLLSHTATACFLFIIHAGFSFFSHSGGFFSFYLTFLFFSFLFISFLSFRITVDRILWGLNRHQNWLTRPSKRGSSLLTGIKIFTRFKKLRDEEHSGHFAGEKLKL